MLLSPRSLAENGKVAGSHAHRTDLSGLMVFACAPFALATGLRVVAWARGLPLLSVASVLERPAHARTDSGLIIGALTEPWGSLEVSLTVAAVAVSLKLGYHTSSLGLRQR